MIYLLVILGIWYVTKIYYTGKFAINLRNEVDNNVKVICNKCSRYLWVDKQSIRTPYYCNNCI